MTGLTKHVFDNVRASVRDNYRERKLSKGLSLVNYQVEVVSKHANTSFSPEFVTSAKKNKHLPSPKVQAVRETKRRPRRKLNSMFPPRVSEPLHRPWSTCNVAQTELLTGQHFTCTALPDFHINTWRHESRPGPFAACRKDYHRTHERPFNNELACLV